MTHDRKSVMARHEVEGGGATIFAKYTEAQVQALRMGTPAYQRLHPYNKEMSAGVHKSHYASLVQPTMSKHNKSISKHLGMNSTQIGGKLGGTA